MRTCGSFMILPWSEIETVFLDMDGTLLDLHFDNHFWLEYLPKRYGEVYGLSFEQAKEALFDLFAKKQGQLQWYCIDYWTDLLNLPVLQFKQDIAHLIRWRDYAEFFLKSINDMGKQVVLITNAHPKSLDLKMRKVNLAPWFSHIISSHKYHYPKEHQHFWQKLQEQVVFNVNTSLFIDDSVSVLRSAKQFGIKYLCAVHQPDSQQPPLEAKHEFATIKDYIDCFDT